MRPSSSAACSTGRALWKLLQQRTHATPDAVVPCFPVVVNAGSIQRSTAVSTSLAGSSVSTSTFASGASQLQAKRAYGVNNRPTVEYVEVPLPTTDPYTTEPTNYLQLLGSIRQSRSLQRLKHLVDTYSDRFDAVHFSAAMARIPHLMRYRDKDLVPTGIVVPSHGLRPVVPKQGAQPRDSHMELAGAIASKLEALMPAHMHRLFPRQVANCVWSLGELAKRGLVVPTEMVEQLLSLIKRQNYDMMQVHGHGTDGAQLLKGLAHLQYHDMALVATLAGFLREHLQQLGRRELQMAAWALASMEFKGADVWAALATRAKQLAKELTPQGISSVMWALTSAGHYEPKVLQSLASGLQPQLVLVNHQDVAMVLSACAQAGYRDDALLQLLADKAVRDLSSFSDLSMAHALSGLATLGFRHAPLMEAVSASVLAEKDVKTSNEIATKVMDAYVKLGYVEDETSLAVLGRLLASFQRQARYAQPRHVAAVCEVLAAVPAVASPALLEAIVKRAEESMESYSPDQMLAVLRAFNVLEQKNMQLFMTATRLAKQRGVEGSWQVSGSVAGGALGLEHAVALLGECNKQDVQDKELTQAILAMAQSTSQEGGSALALLSLAGSCRVAGVDASGIVSALTLRLKAEAQLEALGSAALAEAVGLYAGASASGAGDAGLLAALCDALAPGLDQVADEQLQMLFGAAKKVEVVRSRLLQGVQQVGVQRGVALDAQPPAAAPAGGK